MWKTYGEVVTSAVRDLLRSWRSLALTDVSYKLIAFALLTPPTTLLLGLCCAALAYARGARR